MCVEACEGSFNSIEGHSSGQNNLMGRVISNKWAFGLLQAA